MAYVLGYLFADGSLDDVPKIRAKYMRVTSTDKDRIVLIRKLLSSKHTIAREARGGNYAPKYILSIGSKRLYASLIRRGLTPHKSLTMQLPSIPHRYFGAFLCGYFDGDGCVYIDTQKSKSRGGLGRMIIIFTSGSEKFLEAIHKTLFEQRIVQGRGLYLHSNKRAHQLRYLTDDSANLFRLMYANSHMKDLCLERKYAIFSRYFEALGHTTRVRSWNWPNGEVATRRSAKPLLGGCNSHLGLHRYPID